MLPVIVITVKTAPLPPMQLGLGLIHLDMSPLHLNNQVSLRSPESSLQNKFRVIQSIVVWEKLNLYQPAKRGRKPCTEVCTHGVSHRVYRNKKGPTELCSTSEYPGIRFAYLYQFMKLLWLSI